MIAPTVQERWTARRLYSGLREVGTPPNLDAYEANVEAIAQALAEARAGVSTAWTQTTPEQVRQIFGQEVDP